MAALLATSLACSVTGDSGGPTSTPAPTVEPTVYEQDFSSSDNGWGEGEDDTGSLYVTDGKYSFKIKEENWLTWGNLDVQTYSNIRIEVEVENQSPTDQPTFGIMCHYQDEGNFYYAGVGTDGYYAIIKSENGEDTFLSDPTDNQWKQTSRINVGDKKFNLVMECADGRITLTANGQRIDSVEDSTFERGQIGLFVWTFDEPEAVVHFDNVKVYRSQ